MELVQVIAVDGDRVDLAVAEPGCGDPRARGRYWSSAVDRTRLHHEVAPWYLGDVPEGEWRSCDGLTQNIDWATGEPAQCSRPAHVMYGELALCWQHERSIVYHLLGDERTVPVGRSETRFSYGAIAELEQWLDAKRAREARAAAASEREAAEVANGRRRNDSTVPPHAQLDAGNLASPGPATSAASSSARQRECCLVKRQDADTKRTHQKRHARRLPTHHAP
jgi:hypothetical protein